MEVKELRIGNFLHFPFINKHVEIIGINAYETNSGIEYKISAKEGINMYCEPLTIFREIPITEEWLFNFGFKKLPLEGAYFKMIHGFGREREDSLVYHNGIILSLCQITDTGRIISEMTKRLDINHVHQLQNLYFALTGEELTLKTE